VWLGTDTYPDAGLTEDDYELIEEHPSEHRIIIATEQLPTAVRPGTTFRGERVVAVEHRLTSDDMKTEVWFQRPGASASHPFLGAIEGIVRSEMRTTRYHALYPSRVVSQAADGTLELVPDGDVMPPMTGVALRTFAPGIGVKVAPGSRVQLAFEGGDPSKPVAMLWEADATSLTELKLGDGATKGVARVGDHTRTPITVTVANSLGAASVILTWADENGAPQTLSLGFTGTAQFNGQPAVAAKTVTLSGDIKSGSGKILAED
jgi:hypothetical protein